MKKMVIMIGMLLALLVLTSTMALAVDSSGKTFGAQPWYKQMKAVPGQNQNGMTSSGYLPPPYGTNQDISQCIGAQPVQKQLYAGPGQLIGRMVCWWLN